MSAGRAPVGGCIGVNGAFYEGGEFLPSNPHNPKGIYQRYNKSMKREIEPYKWIEYKGKLKDGEKVDGFYNFFSEDYKVIYGANYEEFIKPYREAWNQGKRFRIFETTNDGCRLIRFE